MMLLDLVTLLFSRYYLHRFPVNRYLQGLAHTSSSSAPRWRRHGDAGMKLELKVLATQLSTSHAEIRLVCSRCQRKTAVFHRFFIVFSSFSSGFSMVFHHVRRCSTRCARCKRTRGGPQRSAGSLALPRSFKDFGAGGRRPKSPRNAQEMTVFDGLSMFFPGFSMIIFLVLT